MKLSQFQTLTLTLLLFVFCFTLIAIKTHYVTIHNRYITPGFDSARILGYTRQLIVTDVFPVFGANRLGLPLFVKYFNQLTSPSPVNTFLIPLWIVNFVAAFNSYFLAWVLSKNHRIALTSFFIYCLITPVILMNDSSFMTFIIIPLRLGVTFLFFESKTKIKSIFLGSLSFLLTIYGNFTYPVLSFLVDMILWWYVLFYGQKIDRKKILVLLLGEFVGFTSLFYYYQTYFNSLPVLKFFERAYSVWALVFTIRIPRWIAAGGVISGYSFILATSPLVFIKSFHSKLKQVISFIEKSFSKAKPLFWLLAVFLLYYYRDSFLGVYQELLTTSKGKPLEDIYTTIRELTSLVMFCFVLVSFPLKKTRLNWLAFLALIYWSLVFFPTTDVLQKIFANSRFTFFFFPFLTLLFSAIFIELKRSMQLILLCLVLFVLPLTSFKRIQHLYRFPAHEKTVKAMEWFVTQPNYTNAFHYTGYVGKPNIASHERPYSLAFAPSIHLWAELRSLHKCGYETVECIGQFNDYITEKSIEYIVIGTPETEIAQELLKLGTIIYDDHVVVVQL